MAFKLKKDELDNFQATAGVVVNVGIAAAATSIASAYYNDTKLPLAADGSTSFTPIVGAYFLTITTNPPYPPEAWQVVEFDGGNSQVLEPEDSDKQVANLVIIGN